MKDKPLTRDQLVVENTRLLKSLNRTEERVSEWRDRDTTIRKDFAKVLGQMSTDYGYSTRSARDLSWNEIFCEVGKLLQYQNREAIERRLSALEERNMPTAESLVAR